MESLTKFLYLTKIEWAEAWINGGRVPVRQASSYRQAERDGIYTPDENNIQTGMGLNGDDADAIRTRIVGPGELHARNIRLPGDRQLENVHIYSREWDGFILCLSNSASPEICLRLKKKACVEILNVSILLENLSRQLGIQGKHGPCIYTQGPDRDVFTKSYKDSWQDEYRLFWDIEYDEQEVIVELSPGMGRLLWTI